MQFLSSEANVTTFVVEEGAGNIEFAFLHKDINAYFNLETANANSREIAITPTKGQGEVFMSTASLLLAPGTYQINSNAAFAAVQTEWPCN